MTHRKLSADKPGLEAFAKAQSNCVIACHTLKERVMRSGCLLIGVLLCLLFANLAGAQGVGTSGDIKGTVVDPTGAVVANASIVAVETAKGIQHNTITNESGQYRFSGLAPSVYSVTARGPGFAPEVRRNVTVVLGETAAVDFHLQLSTVSNQVEVQVESGETPMVDVERTSQADTLGQQYINDLPIDRRDYLTFSLLMPGVSASTTLVDDQDLRGRELPQSGLSFYGSNGRGNSVTVDGSSFNGYSQFVIVNVSQDA